MTQWSARRLTHFVKNASAALIAPVRSAQLAALIDFALIGGGFLIQVFALPHVLWADGEARAHDVRALLHGTLTGCPWPKLDLKAIDQTVARSALSTMALKNG